MIARKRKRITVCERFPPLNRKQNFCDQGYSLFLGFILYNKDCTINDNFSPNGDIDVDPECFITLGSEAVRTLNFVGANQKYDHLPSKNLSLPDLPL